MRKKRGIKNKKRSSFTKNSILLFAAFILSFLVTSVVSIVSLTMMARDNTKEVDMMLTARVYDIISKSVSEPITVTRAMTADKFLVDALKAESDDVEKDSQIMKEYLSNFKGSLNYDSAFVVSAKTRRYYTYDGLHKIVDPENEDHDEWYSIFLESGKYYDLDVDADEMDRNQWTVFVNARVEDENGNLLGVCGVGVHMTNLQGLFSGLEKEYNVKINLVDDDGLVQVDTDEKNIENSSVSTDFISQTKSSEYKYSNIDGNKFAISKYVDYLEWYLVVQSNSDITKREFMQVIIFNISVSLVAMAVVFYILSLIMKRLNRGAIVAESLNDQLSSMADIYMSVHDLDIENDTFSEILTNDDTVADILGNGHYNAQQTLFLIMDQLTAVSSKHDINKFIDFSTINERMKDTKTITIEFMNYKNLWLRGRFIVSQRDEEGNITHVLWMVEDIDKEKRNRDRMMEAIRNMNTQMSSIANQYFSLHDIDFVNDKFTVIRTNVQEVDGIFQKQMDNAREVIFYAVDEMASDVSRDAMRRFVDFNTLNQRLKGRDVITEEFLSSSNIWCRARFIVSNRTDTGSISHVLYLVGSIDEEKRRRDKLSEAAQKLTSQIMSISNIYMTMYEFDVETDTFFEIKSQSRLVAEVIGYTRNNARSTLKRVMRSVTDRSCIDDVLKFTDLTDLDRRFEHTDTMAIEYLNKEKEWRRGRLLVSKRDEERHVLRILWLVEDIDEEKKERDELIDRSERAIAASEAKSSFLSNMSHEIRTPINAVLGMNEMILRECEDKNILAYSESIRTAGSTLLGLVNDILDFSKIEAGKMDIIPVDYDLSSVLNDLVNMIRTRADDKGLMLTLDFNKDTPKFLNGDEIRIKQVITNILTNAVKYTEKGSVVFSVDYVIPPDDPESILLSISVKDTGIGIKEEDRKKLFSEFERIEEDRNRSVEGTGLGMSITKRLLEMMGSSLKVNSVYGLGSRFYFLIKQKVVKWENLGDYEESYKKSLASGEKYKEKFTAPDADILVVDDNPMNLMVIKSLLKQTRIKVDTAESGDESLILAYDKKYDMIFMDHMMPEKDGIQTFHELRAQENNPNLETPVICLTANAISGAREQYMAEGFNDYLTKPIDSSKLEDLLIMYLPEDKIRLSGEGSDDAENGAVNEAEDGIIPPAVREIAELDIASGIRNNGGEAAYLDSLKLYTDMIDKYIEEIGKFMKAGDIQNATIKIHALKSTSKIIGANDIGEYAQMLENAGKANDIAALEGGYDSLLERCRDVGAKLVEIFGAGDDAEDDSLPPISEEQLNEEYARIKQFAEDFDSMGVEDILNELKKAKIPESEKERFRALTQAAENFDFDAIADILS